MPLIIGMDEAGYGPNLGPLVVTATVWEVPGDPRKCDLWKLFAPVVSPDPAQDDSQIQIADSKQVYTPSKGLANLEAGVHCGLRLCDRMATSFHRLWDKIAPDSSTHRPTEPWFAHDDLDLPVATKASRVEAPWLAWQELCRNSGVRLREIRSDIVLTERFNSLTREHASKGRALSHITLNLLSRVWSLDNDPRALVIADKHGGRNRYQELLPLAVEDRFIICHEESTPSSRYRVGEAEIRFEMQAERYLPVALASMVSKYLREISMKQFNSFWKKYLPDLLPTAGYPGDARRFHTAIANCRKELRISDSILWRDK